MKRKILPLIIVVLSIAALGWLAQWRLADSGGKGAGKRPDKPVTVETATVKVQPMPVFLQAVGQVQSEHSVQIRPQVSGQLQQVYFAEGDAVKKGQKLFRIDPSQYETALIAARAEYEYAKEQAKRLEPLAGKEYVTTQEYDNARAAVDKAQAALGSGEDQSRLYRYPRAHRRAYRQSRRQGRQSGGARRYGAAGDHQSDAADPGAVHHSAAEPVGAAPLSGAAQHPHLHHP